MSAACQQISITSSLANNTAVDEASVVTIACSSDMCWGALTLYKNPLSPEIVATIPGTGIINVNLRWNTNGVALYCGLNDWPVDVRSRHISFPVHCKYMYDYILRVKSVCKLNLKWITFIHVSVLSGQIQYFVCCPRFCKRLETQCSRASTRASSDNSTKRRSSTCSILTSPTTRTVTLEPSTKR